MRKPIIALALSIMIAGTAAPALAHGGNRAEAAYLTPARNAEIRRDINQLDNRIQRAQTNRAISPREAQGLRRDARDIKRTYTRSANRGLSVAEFRNLERRIATVNARLRIEKRDRDGRRG